MKTAEEFWACVNKDGPIHPTLNTKCWLWTRALSKSGYGKLWFLGDKRAHRMSWELMHESPGKLFVCHRCDNRKCVNPEHLFLDTAAGNNEDMIQKGRAAAPHGETVGNAVLTTKTVKLIHQLATSELTIADIAKQAGINSRYVGIILRGKAWRHLCPSQGVSRVFEPRAKLNEHTVISIREKFAAGGTRQALAKEYGVDASTISNVVNRRTWKHV